MSQPSPPFPLLHSHSVSPSSSLQAVPAAGEASLAYFSPSPTPTATAVVREDSPTALGPSPPLSKHSSMRPSQKRIAENDCESEDGADEIHPDLVAPRKRTRPLPARRLPCQRHISNAEEDNAPALSAVSAGSGQRHADAAVPSPAAPAAPAFSLTPAPAPARTPARPQPPPIPPLEMISSREDESADADVDSDLEITSVVPAHPTPAAAAAAAAANVGVSLLAGHGAMEMILGSDHDGSTDEDDDLFGGVDVDGGGGGVTDSDDSDHSMDSEEQELYEAVFDAIMDALPPDDNAIMLDEHAAGVVGVGEGDVGEGVGGGADNAAHHSDNEVEIVSVTEPPTRAHAGALMPPASGMPPLSLAADPVAVAAAAAAAAPYIDIATLSALPVVARLGLPPAVEDDIVHHVWRNTSPATSVRQRAAAAAAATGPTAALARALAVAPPSPAFASRTLPAMIAAAASSAAFGAAVPEDPTMPGLLPLSSLGESHLPGAAAKGVDNGTVSVQRASSRIVRREHTAVPASRAVSHLSLSRATDAAAPLSGPSASHRPARALRLAPGPAPAPTPAPAPAPAPGPAPRPSVGSLFAMPPGVLAHAGMPPHGPTPVSYLAPPFYTFPPAAAAAFAVGPHPQAPYPLVPPPMRAAQPHPYPQSPSYPHPHPPYLHYPGHPHAHPRSDGIAASVAGPGGSSIDPEGAGTALDQRRLRTRPSFFHPDVDMTGPHHAAPWAHASPFPHLHGGPAAVSTASPAAAAARAPASAPAAAGLVMHGGQERMRVREQPEMDAMVREVARHETNARALDGRLAAMNDRLRLTVQVMQRLQAAGLMAPVFDLLGPRGIRGAALDDLTLSQTLTAADALQFTARGACAICLEEYEESQLVRRLPCLCVFHGTCIERHLDDSTRCPLCRTDVRRPEPTT